MVDSARRELLGNSCDIVDSGGQDPKLPQPSRLGHCDQLTLLVAISGPYLEVQSSSSNLVYM